MWRCVQELRGGAPRPLPGSGVSELAGLSLSGPGGGDGKASGPATRGDAGDAGLGQLPRWELRRASCQAPRMEQPVLTAAEGILQSELALELLCKSEPLSEVPPVLGLVRGGGRRGEVNCLEKEHKFRKPLSNRTQKQLKKTGHCSTWSQVCLDGDRRNNACSGTVSRAGYFRTTSSLVTFLSFQLFEAHNQIFQNYVLPY